MSALLAAVLLASQGALAQPQEAPAAEPAPPDRRVELDERRFYTNAQLATALRAIADAYPELVRLESLGTSRGGHELWVATLSTRDGADPSSKAALLVVGALGADDAQGAEMALFTLFDLVQNRERDPAVATVLEAATLYFVPCLDPDRRALLLKGPGDGALPRSIDLDANFPRSWTPWGEGRSGPYPLSEPEPRALVEFLAGHPNVAMLQTFAGEGLELASESRAEVSAEDRAIYATVVASSEALDEDPGHLAAFPMLPARAGSLLDYAALELGVYGFTCDVTGRVGTGLPQVSELAPLARRARTRALLLTDVLASLQLERAVALELQPGLWQVDVALANVGRLPTLSGEARRRRAALPTRISVEGARLLAVALAESPEGPFAPLNGPVENGTLPPIQGGERLHLRLVLEGEAGGELQLAVTSSRAGVVRAAIALE